MPTGLHPDASVDTTTGRSDPQAVVEAFLAALAVPDMPRAMSFVADDIAYTNVGLPTIRGRSRVTRFLGLLDRPGSRFEVYLHAIAVDDRVVLTERTDVLSLGPFRAQFWVWGRFEVDDGKIALWRDSFDYLDFFRALLRGLLGMVLPGLRPRPPQRQETPPGRHRN